MSKALDSFVRTMPLAELLMRSIRKSAYVTFLQSSGSTFTSYGRWAGEEDTTSRSPYISPVKAAELHFQGKGEKRFAETTPTGLQLGLGWQGGVRFGNLTVAVSNLQEEHDKLLAAILLYALHEEVRLNHVGFRVEGFSQLQEKREESRYGRQTSSKSAIKDVYEVPTALSPSGKYWEVYSYFPLGPRTPSVYWEVATTDPYRFLHFVAGVFNDTPDYYKNSNGRNALGVYWVTDIRGDKIGIKAREVLSSPLDEDE